MQRQRRVGRSLAWGHLLWGCSSPEPQRWGTEPQARPMQGGDTPTGDLHSGVPSAAAAAKRLAEPALAHGQAVPPRPVRAAWAWGAAAARHRPAHVALLPPGGGHPPGLSTANCGSTLAEEGAVPGATRTPGRRVFIMGQKGGPAMPPAEGTSGPGVLSGSSCSGRCPRGTRVSTLCVYLRRGGHRSSPSSACPPAVLLGLVSTPRLIGVFMVSLRDGVSSVHATLCDPKLRALPVSLSVGRLRGPWQCWGQGLRE